MCHGSVQSHFSIVAVAIILSQGHVSFLLLGDNTVLITPAFFNLLQKVTLVHYITTSRLTGCADPEWVGLHEWQWGGEG